MSSTTAGRGNKTDVEGQESVMLEREEGGKGREAKRGEGGDGTGARTDS